MDFEKELSKKNLSESTQKTYLRNLHLLQKHFGASTKNPLAFLKETDAVESFLSKYKPNTKRSYLISIVSILGLDPKQTKIHKVYYDKMMEINKMLKNVERSGVKSEQQEENWMDWKEVAQIESELESHKNESFNDLLKYLVLSLYTKLPPRRNEYRNMLIVKSAKGLPADTNYLDVANKQFVFNQFKTAKKEGQVIIAIPESLMKIINEYIKARKLKITASVKEPFLVDASGKPLVAVNSITRILNEVFGKKIGSSMLRHLYLSSKYGDIKQEQEEDSKLMSHSTSTQSDYVKK
jgi:integrase